MINNYNKWKFETTFQDIFRVKLNLLSEENNMEISLLKKVILNDSINKLKLSWFNLESRILLAGIAIKRMQMTGNSMFIKSMAHNDSAETRDRRIAGGNIFCFAIRSRCFGRDETLNTFFRFI